MIFAAKIFNFVLECVKSFKVHRENLQSDMGKTKGKHKEF